MPYYMRCGKEVPVTGRYCPNCGQAVDGSMGGSAAPVAPTTPVNVFPYAVLTLLAFLLPLAFACDGYRRAKSP